MIFGILTLITALSISAVAIYYSVAGLVAIFAAAALPIMIMGGALEIAKLVTAVWLHRYWKQATWWLRTYLSTAVIVLMFITSMGIFGFLSKAHIEQTSASEESVARVETIQKEIDRRTAIIGRAENEIRKLESTGSGSDAQVQAQIDKEQERIDSAYSRIQPAIDEQQRIINSQGQLYKDELARVDEQLATLQGYIDAGEIKKAQAMIGARQDGQWGSKTAAAAEEWRKGRQQARADLLTKIETATNNPQARAAANEIKRLRTTVEAQIAESNKLINRLRAQIGQTDNTATIQKSIDEQNERIRLASSEIDSLTEERISLEAEYRKLEAEVGPIKYIAEFIYGEQANTNMLEEAVRWVIIVIIFVFDPLAVLLLIAAQYTFEFSRKPKQEDDDGESLRLEREEYERSRAQRIVDNPGYTIDPAPVQEEEKVDDTLSRDAGTGNNGRDASSGMAVARKETVDVKEPTITTNDAVGDVVPEDDIANTDEPDTTVEQPEVQADEQLNQEVDSKKKSDTKSLEELKREAEYDEKEKDENFQLSKTAWKEAHPDQTLKHFKNLYVKGLIDSLPWERSADDDNYNSVGYQQNAEQNESTLFNKLSKK